MAPAHHCFGMIAALLLSGCMAFPSLCLISKVSQSSHAPLHETQSNKCILRQVCHCASQTATASLGDRIFWDHHRICNLAMIEMSRCGLQLCVSTCRHAFFTDYTTLFPVSCKGNLILSNTTDTFYCFLAVSS